MMTYTLKLDWDAAVIDSVLQLLAVQSSASAREMHEDLAFYRGVDATIKVGWPEEWIKELFTILHPHENTQAAAREILAYRANVHAQLLVTDLLALHELVPVPLQGDVIWEGPPLSACAHCDTNAGEVCATRALVLKYFPGAS